MAEARVSVIIPTFNRARMLPTAVESARQAGGDPEVIVIDDASTDETPEVCAGLRDVRVIRLKKNVGLGAARNEGIRESRGEYIALLDDDDKRLPDSLPAQMRALEAEPEAAFCYGRVLIGDPATGASTGESVPTELPVGDVFWKLLRGNFIPGLSVLLRRAPLFAAGLFNSRLRQVEDWELWLRLTEHRPVVAIDRPVAIYRMFQNGSGQLSSNRALMARAAAEVQRRASQLPRAKMDPARARECRRQFMDETRYALLHESIDALLAGSRKHAYANLFAIARLSPSDFFENKEARALLGLSIATRPRNLRDYEKRLKAVRKQLWAKGPSNAAQVSG